MDPRRASAFMQQAIANSDSDRGSADHSASAAGSDPLVDPFKEMSAEDFQVLADAGRSYDVDLSRAYTLELKGVLCFVAMKVPRPLVRLGLYESKRVETRPGKDDPVFLVFTRRRRRNSLTPLSPSMSRLATISCCCGSWFSRALACKSFGAPWRCRAPHLLPHADDATRPVRDGLAEATSSGDPSACDCKERGFF